MHSQTNDLTCRISMIYVTVKLSTVMRFIISLLLVCSSLVAMATELDTYMQEYSTSRKSDYLKEKELIEGTSTKKILKELNTYYNDSLEYVRQKAYYLSHKKGLLSKSNGQTLVVGQLLKGCSDKDGGLVGQNLQYLSEYPSESFDEASTSQLKRLLVSKRMPHYKKLVLLCGYVGVGTETLNKKLLEPELAIETKWILSLALARQGDSSRIQYCITLARKMPVNDNFVAYIIPEIIYTKQKSAIDYCVELLNNNENLCSSADPDNPQKILCGYRLMELLAPTIEDFPYNTDGTGSLNTKDYERALQEVRAWFKANPNYSINSDIY